MSPTREVVIENIDQLESLLSRAYWIENEFEDVVQWDAYTVVDEKYRDTLFELSNESEGHKNSLKKLISNLSGLDLETVKQNSRAKEDAKFKRHSQDVEILYEVYENDKLALDLYGKIHSKTSKEFIEEVWEGEDPNEFFETLSELIEEEQGHIDELNKYAKKLDRIR